jgi:phage regulator Rha-like protein
MNLSINKLTMTSREIAELTGKEHKHVLADIRTMLQQLNLITADFSSVYKASNNQEYECFNLPKRECLILVSGYSILLRSNIIDRWQELEQQQTPTLPKTYKEALQALILAEEVKEQQALQIDNLSTALDTLNDWASILKIAKHNNVSEKQFFWRELKSMSEKMGYVVKKASSPRFGYQNLYNIAVFKACYPQFKYTFNNEN